jgi:tetratricopeptide (TPR) repeat protein
MWTIWLIALAISAITVAVYWQISSNLFINYDDNLYVTGNPQVQAGLSWNSIVWAFSTKHTGNWIPVTWLSHMLDCQLYRLAPAGHHVTSLLIHLANAALLFLLFQKLTGHIWQSAFVAAIFAVHPVNVESVAWIAERKNLLCTLFWLLTIWAYVRYAARPDWKRYALVVVAFALALMSKPMAVSLPFVLLLIDYWPLGRLRPLELPGFVKFRVRPSATPPAAESSKAALSKVPEPYLQASISRLILEKVPLLMLAIADSLITMTAQRESGSVTTFQAVPIGLRIENAVVSYSAYLGELLWPDKLAVFYPYPRHFLPAWQVAAAALVLAAGFVALLAASKRVGYSGTGCLWYLGTLIPVIGLVQVGGQSMADRYQYIPMLGILTLMAWGLADLTRGRRLPRNIVVLSAIAGVLALAIAARGQLGYWGDSEALFNHAQAVTENNYVAYNNLGEAVADKGRTQEAAGWFARAVDANPDYPAAQQNLGMALIQQGNLDEGIAHLTRTTELDPRSYDAFNKLGAVLARKGHLDDAITALTRSLEINPAFAPALANMAIVLEQQDKFDESAASFEKAIQNAGSVEMAAQWHFRLGNLLARRGDVTRAAQQYRDALRLKSDFQPALEALRKIPTSNR